MSRPAKPLAERFHAKHTTGSGCWIWQSYKDRNGFPLMYLHGTRLTTAARVSYTLKYGPIPHGRFVSTSCGNRDCVRPDHLKLVTTRGPEPKGR